MGAALAVARIRDGAALTPGRGKPVPYGATLHGAVPPVGATLAVARIRDAAALIPGRRGKPVPYGGRQRWRGRP